MYRFLVLILMLASFPGLGAGDVYTGFFSNKAISGYDSVSFFSGTPIKGNASFSVNFKGAVWLFSNKHNLDAFIENPEKYAPQYGGYCAWAMAKNNDLAPGNPEYWKIVGNKLYLNYDKDIQDKWDEHIPEYIIFADKNWNSR